MTNLTNLDAEASVLGACLHSPNALTECATILEPGDFHSPQHETIWIALTDLHAAAHGVDPVTVSNHLRAQGALDRVGGPTRITDLYTSVHVASNATYYARIVRGLATRRRVTAAATRITQLAAGDLTPDQVVSLAVSELEAAHRPDASDTPTLVGDLIDGILDDLDADVPEGGVLWPWADLNGPMNALRPGQLVLLAGRPAMGKSVALVDVARDAAIRQDKTVVMHSLEMSREEVMHRILAAEARIPLDHITRHTLSEAEWDRIAQARARLSEARLHIVDTAQVGIAEIRSSLRTYQPDLLVLDYIQLAARNPRLDPRQGLDELARALKVAAKTHGVPIVSAAQLARAAENRSEATPRLSDLRESGALEQDADAVILLHRPDYYEPESSRAGEIDLIIAKQRGGATRTVPLVHQLHYARIVDPGR